MLSTKASVTVLVGIFFSSAACLALVYLSFPQLSEYEREKVRLPRNVEQARELGLVLSKYREDHYLAVFSALLVVYVFLQSFAIPGSIFLSILSGYLFPFPLALLLVCSVCLSTVSCSAVGASICYLLSYLVGRAIVMKYFPERIRQWSMQVAKNRDNLLNYIIFLRITPFLPNWFINLASPVLEVPLSPFFIGTLVGVAPPSIFFVQAGTTLEQMTTSPGSSLDWRCLGLLALCAGLSLVPVALRSRIRAKME